MHKNRYMRQRFNMTELVLVVTLIVCVAAVLLPSVYRGLVRGKAAACQANLKELGNWMTVYVDDHDDYLPAYEDGWVEPLAEIGGGGGGSGVPAGVFACPSQKAVSLDPAGETEAAAWWHGSMYGINQHIASKLVDRNGQPLPWWTRLQTSSIQTSSAADKVLLADAAGGNYFGTPDRDPTVAGLSRYGTNYVHSLPPDPVSPFPALRHAGETGPGSGNFLFLDGHVEARRFWPRFMLGRNTTGYEFWHGQHWYPGLPRSETKEPGERKVRPGSRVQPPPEHRRSTP